MPENHYIAMLIPDGTNPFFNSLAQAFQRKLTEHNCGLIVLSADGRTEREAANLETAMSLDIDALIVVSAGDNFEIYSQLKEVEYPILVLDRSVPLEENGDFAVTDNWEGIERGMDYLTRLNHTRVGFVKGPKNTQPGRERLAAFEQYCKANDINCSDEIIFEGDFGFGSGKRVGEKLLQLENLPTAIFASNDLMALGVLQELQESGIDIPDEISILGYDDIKMTSWVNPPLSSVRQNVDRIAREGVDLLLDRLNQEPEQNALMDQRTRTITPRVIDRKSTTSI